MVEVGSVGTRSIKILQMTSDQLREILERCWDRNISAYDAMVAIWGEDFEGYTEKLPIHQKTTTTEDTLLLANEYYFGDHSTEEDLSKAVALYHQLAAQGNIHAMMRLIDAYDCGNGVEIDREEAKRWEDKAREKFQTSKLEND